MQSDQSDLYVVLLVSWPPPPNGLRIEVTKTEPVEQRPAGAPDEAR
jgi:hypothetical protein